MYLDLHCDYKYNTVRFIITRIMQHLFTFLLDIIYNVNEYDIVNNNDIQLVHNILLLITS